MTKTADFGRCRLLLSRTDCVLEYKAEQCEECFDLLLAEGKQLYIMSKKHALNAAALLAEDEDIQSGTALVSFVGFTAISLLHKTIASSRIFVPT